MSSPSDPGGGPGGIHAIPAGQPDAPVPDAGAPPSVPAEPEAPEKHPLHDEISEWMQLLNRALGATRFYPPTNEIRSKQVDAAVKGASRLLDKEPSISLRVRETTLNLNKLPILEDDDRVNGLPSLLFSNSIFEISFSRGLQADELRSFIEALVVDYSADENRGGDLVAALWRLDLASISYQHVDVLAAAFRSGEDELGAIEDEETRRLKQSLNELVSALAINRQDGSDFRMMFDNALATPDSARAAEEWEAGNLKNARALLDSKLKRGDVDSFVREAEAQNAPEKLANRVLDAILDALAASRDEDSVQRTLAFLTRLVDGMVAGRDFNGSLAIVERLQGIVGKSGDATKKALVRELLDRLGAEEQIGAAVEALNQASSAGELSRILDFIRVVGARALPGLLHVVNDVEQLDLMEPLAEVIMDGAREDAGALIDALPDLRWELAVAAVRTSEKLPHASRSALIWAAGNHDNPEVRSEAIKLVEGFGGKQAESLLVRSLKDSDTEVRQKALELVGEREIASAQPQLSRLLRMRESSDMQADELRALMIAYARVGKGKVVSDLSRILHGTGKLLDIKKTLGVQVDAAAAIALIDHETARDALRKGAKSLNPALRKACKDALETSGGRKFGMTGPNKELPDLGPPIDRDRSNAPGDSNSIPPASTPPKGGLPDGMTSIPVTPSGSIAPAPVFDSPSSSRLSATARSVPAPVNAPSSAPPPQPPMSAPPQPPMSAPPQSPMSAPPQPPMSAPPQAPVSAGPEAWAAGLPRPPEDLADDLSLDFDDEEEHGLRVIPAGAIPPDPMSTPPPAPPIAHPSSYPAPEADAPLTPSYDPYAAQSSPPVKPTFDPYAGQSAPPAKPTFDPYAAPSAGGSMPPGTSMPPESSMPPGQRVRMAPPPVNASSAVEVMPDLFRGPSQPPVISRPPPATPSMPHAPAPPEQVSAPPPEQVSAPPPEPQAPAPPASVPSVDDDLFLFLEDDDE